jgi:hypothetical protein
VLLSLDYCHWQSPVLMTVDCLEVLLVQLALHALQ